MKKNILVTGGTGSFGSSFIKRLLKGYPNLRRIVIYSRDELKQWQMQQKYNPNKSSKKFNLEVSE